MPSASDELREFAMKTFGSLDSSGPEDFLRSRKFILHPFWNWTKSGTTYANMEQDEYLCILFLHDEWDYGSFVESPD